MKSKSTRFLAFLGVLAVAACGDDPTGTSNLSEAESQQLATAVLTTALSAFGAAQAGGPMLSADGPALVPYEHEFDWEGSVQCAGGGAVSVVALVSTSGDSETGEAFIDMEFTQVHSNCVVQSGAQPFTFNGNPSVVVAMTSETDGEGTISYAGSITGALDYEFDGRSGTCSIDYDQEGTTNINTNSGSYSLTGSICGHSLNWQYSFGA